MAALLLYSADAPHESRPLACYPCLLVVGPIQFIGCLSDDLARFFVIVDEEPARLAEFPAAQLRQWTVRWLGNSFNRLTLYPQGADYVTTAHLLFVHVHRLYCGGACKVMFVGNACTNRFILQIPQTHSAEIYTNKHERIKCTDLRVTHAQLVERAQGRQNPVSPSAAHGTRTKPSNAATLFSTIRRRSYAPANHNTPRTSARNVVARRADAAGGAGGGFLSALCPRRYQPR